MDEFRMESIKNRIQVLDGFVRGQVKTDDVQTSILTRDGLMDSLIALYEECNHDNLKKNKLVAAFVKKYESTIKELKRIRLKVADFEVKDVIGRGHYGEVQVVKERSTDTVFAMKKLNKHQTLNEKETSCYEEERDIMAKATSEWITLLYYAFQDTRNLYLVMEYHGGGDLLSLLSRHDDIFEEPMCRFYVAEMTQAIHALHCMGYVHRDIKPENILLDSTGHVKLADFGSAAQLSSDLLVHVESSKMKIVGTPDYVPPELLTSMNNDNSDTRYGVEVDWWCLGVCMYEMLYGKLPFTDECATMVVTYSNIMNFKECLKFPDKVKISSHAVDLMKKLMAEKTDRYGYDEILAHSFFKGTKWDKIRQETPPFVPHLSSLDDTSNFDELEERGNKGPSFDDFMYHDTRDFSGRDLPFVGFSFVRKPQDDNSIKLAGESLTDLDTTTASSSTESTCSTPPRNMEVTLTVKINELHGLKKKYHELEEKECSLKSQVDKWRVSCQEKDEELMKVTVEKDALEQELQSYITKANKLKDRLDVAIEEKELLECRADKLYEQIRDMNSEVQQIEEEILRTQVEELNDLVSELEKEKKKLLKKISDRDQQLKLNKEQIGQYKKQMERLQTRLDKERRKSQDNQRRDLTLLETREETWRSQMEDKNTEIADLNNKLQELEDLVEAFEIQEKEFMEREQYLLKRLEECEQVDKVELRVLFHTKSRSGRHSDGKKTKRIEELTSLIQKHSSQADLFREKEEELEEQNQKLHSEIEMLRHQASISSQTKDTLVQQVKAYQEEVLELKSKIKTIQESINLYMESQDNAKKDEALQTQIKTLEVEVDLLHDDKRKLRQDLIASQQELEERKFKITEQERVLANVTQTVSRLTCRLERVERQLNETRDRDIELRVKMREHQDLRNKLSSERIAELEKENKDLKKKVAELEENIEKLNISSKVTEDQSSEISRLKLEVVNYIEKINATQEKLDGCKKEKFDLDKKIRDLQGDNDNLETSLKKSKDEVNRLEKQVSEMKDEQKELQKVKLEKDRLNFRIAELEQTAEKAEAAEKFKKERDTLEVKVQNLEKDLSDLKILSAKRWNKVEDAEDLRQENKYLEGKIKSQQETLQQLEVKLKNLEEQTKEGSKKDNKIKSLMEEIDKLRLEKRSLEVKLWEANRELEQKQQISTESKKDVVYVEEKLHKEKEQHEEDIQEIRRELEEANLALSEARSLLAATQRQEKSMKERLEADIRELQLKIHKLEKLRPDNDEDINILKSERDQLNRQIKEQDERLSKIQREKSSAVMERQSLKDSLQQKEHQLEVETKKVEKLQHICGELEEQIRDLEAINTENEERQAEWEKIKKTFEVAVDEREEEIEGSTQKIHALEEAKQSASHKIHKFKDQLQQAKAKHKVEVEELNHKVWEANRSSQKLTIEIGQLREQLQKQEMSSENVKRLMEVETEDKRKLKEEISQLITENQELRKKNLKIKHNLEEAMDKFEMIFGEKVNLENFAEALQGLHFLDTFRFQSTLNQQMKLIDYLQELYKENNGKKKKGGKLFGGKGKDKLTSSPSFNAVGDLAAALELEKKKNARLQEQVDRLRQENFNQANELLRVKGPIMDNYKDTITPDMKKAMETLSRTPSTHGMLTPSVKRAASIHCTQQRMQHRIPHRFATGLNTRATKCGVCLGSVPFVKQASKCQECHMTCHPKCASSAKDNCGLPIEYIQQFSSIMGQVEKSSQKYSPILGDVPIKMEGWLKVPRTEKQGWERRWASLENNILLLFMQEYDASPVDTFDLGPPNTDVTVHSAISTAELPNTTSTDLAHVMKLEQEPLTTCWPGRVLYLMASNFSDKQKWIACLEAVVKSLQRKDTIVRHKMYSTTLLELAGDRRLELNHSFALCKELVLLGCDEGLFSVNVYNGKHALVTKLSGFNCVHQILYISSLNLIVIVTGRERSVVIIDKRMIHSRVDQANSAAKEETNPVPHTVIEGIVGCTVMDAGKCQAGSYMVVGMADRVLLLKYNSELKSFCLRKEFMTSEPCSCVCLAPDFAVIGTDKFYRISLDHPNITDFVDKRDNSLAFAAFGAAIHNSFPLAVVKVSPEGLPLEFLICFHEFGFYVDAKGRRSRPAELKWSCLPLAFAYSEPFLYVTYFNSVQCITIPADKKETRGKQTCLDIQGPRFLGKGITRGTIYIMVGTGYMTELVLLQGNDGVSSEFRDDEKENRPKSPGKFLSPMKGSIRPSHMRRQLSLTSLDSNFSEVSVTSADSRTTMESDV